MARSLTENLVKMKIAYLENGLENAAATLGAALGSLPRKMALENQDQSRATRKKVVSRKVMTKKAIPEKKTFLAKKK
jgi:hypothetical protein